MSDEIMADEEKEIAASPTRRLRFAPIEYSGKTYDSLLLREPSVGDLIEMRKQMDAVASMAILLGRVAGVPPQVVHKLPQSVLQVATEYFEVFFVASPQAGKA